jgi:peptidoglycan/LPS O-acetylase OafA/YrhL
VRDNSFTFIRLTLASGVVLSHSFALSGLGLDPLQRWSGGQLSAGSIGVIGFFAISGFLLTQSLDQNPSVSRYCLHRAARILPGYWAVLLLTALVLAPILIHWEVSGKLSYGETLFLGPSSAFDYLAKNWMLQIGQEKIGALFAGNPGLHSVNGSLWTLYHEAMCYVGLLLLSVFGGLRRQVTLLLWGAVYGLQILDFADHEAFITISPFSTMAAHFLSIGIYRALYLSFLSGVLIHQLRLPEKWSRAWFGIAVTILILSIPCRLSPVVWPVTLPWILISLAHRLPFSRVEGWGDWSYGIYIYAFPIQQCLALVGLYHFGIVPFLLGSLTFSFLAGAASWHLVERPILRWARGVFKKTPKTAVSNQLAVETIAVIS